VARVGVLGGSFDPVHLAHLIVAERVREELALDHVLLVPAAAHPLKPGPALAGGADRLAMLVRAAAGKPGVRVESLELERGGVSYTVDTLTELRRGEPGAALHLILGSDAYRLFERWRRPADVRSLARIVVVPRGERLPPSTTMPSGAEAAAAALSGNGDLVVNVPVLDISASDLRSRVARGLSIRYLVPEAVRDYIAARGLYREPREPR
jgi:nicotinate-nucleotide adenylyltransferase